MAYCSYAETEGNPCFVIIGLHGFADEPMFLFAVPDLRRSVLQKYEIGNDTAILPL